MYEPIINRLTKHYYELENLSNSLEETMPLTHNIERLLTTLKRSIKGSSYSFYLFDEDKQKYVLKASHKAVDNVQIAPSYSGLVAFNGIKTIVSSTISKEALPQTVELLNDNGTLNIWMPIEGVKGLIIIERVHKCNNRMLCALKKNSSLVGDVLCRIQANDVQISERKRHLRNARNYALYYGYGKLKDLMGKDLVIIEPKGFTHAEFKELRATTKLIIAYVSVLEVHPSEAIFRELVKSDFIMINGKPLKNEVFGTFVVSLRSKKWIAHLLDKFKDLINRMNVDGLFLDTIGNLEWATIPKKEWETQLAIAVNLVSVFKTLYPAHLLIQNNGLQSVIDQTAPYVDGICWENPLIHCALSDDWTRTMIDKCTRLSRAFSMSVFLLVEQAVENNYSTEAVAKLERLSVDKGFLLYKATKNYV